MSSVFTLSLQKFAEKAKQDVDTVARKVAFEAFSAVVMRSPVDTGQFRANWLLSVGAPAQGYTLKKTDPSGAQATAEASKALNIPAGNVVYFVNNLPYAQRLEFGWSKQAPGGMVRLTIKDMQQFLKKAVDNVR